MSFISLFLRTVNDSVNDFKMIQPYSEPKISTGGVNITEWKNHSKKRQAEALSKDWFIYFSFRDPQTGKLKRQPHIKAGVNKLKTKLERVRFLKTMQRNLLMLLERGFNPYQDNEELKATFFGDSKKKETVAVSKKEEIKTEAVVPESIVDSKIPSVTVSEAFKKGLLIKKRELSPNSYRGYVSHVNRFEKWLKGKKLDKKPISIITRRLVIEYLNSVLQTSSSRNRNNVRASLSSLFKTLEYNDIIQDNFISKINVLKTKPTRHKSYKPEQVKMLKEYMVVNDPILLLFVDFVYYNYLRPIEVCRLRIGDLDIKDKKLYVKAKNKALKTKIIPQILLEKLPDLSEMDKNLFLFTPDKIGGQWDIDENNKRDYFSKRFKVVKDHFGLGLDYGLYSYRHTSISKLFGEFRKELTEDETISKLKPITGHTTTIALLQYLRDIDAELPEDYSEMLKN